MKMKEFVEEMRDVRLKVIEGTPSLKNSKEVKKNERLESQLLLMNQEREIKPASVKRLKMILKKYNL